MWFYNFGLILYVWAIRLVAPRHPKARLWIEGRKDLFRRMREAIAPTDRIIWIHVASLGEFEQGRPIIEQLRKTHPEYKILLTFFSPSGYEIRKNYKGVDYIFYLPIDTPGNARRFLDAAHPEIAIFVKYEYWLNLLRELRRRKIRTYVVSAIFRRNSVFFRPYGGMWRQALESFDVMFVQNEESKKLLATLGFDNVLVAGDTRFDRVAEIARAARRIDVIDRFKGDNRLFVAGSTWEPDEELLIRLINDNPDVKFVVAPHEMDESRIARLMAETKGGALRYTQCMPLSLLMGFAAYLARQSAKGMPVKRTLSLNITAFVVVLLLATCFAFAVSAEGEATTAVMTAAERAASNESMALGLIAAALVTGLAGIGGGMAVAAGAPAAIAAASEDPKSFGKSLIFVALGESIALYGVVISILILNKLV